MASLFSLRTYLRLVGAAGVVCLALLLVSLDPFLSAASTSGQTPEFTVNHFRKGDRLPLFNSLLSGSRSAPASGIRLETTEKVPLGCDPAFSPVAAPSAVVVYGRCTV